MRKLWLINDVFATILMFWNPKIAEKLARLMLLVTDKLCMSARNSIRATAVSQVQHQQLPVFRR